MGNEIIECIDLVNNEIEIQKEKVDNFEVTGLVKMGRIEGLEIAKRILTDYYEEFC